ncbi:class I SAM-dependent methyltransferase [Uruburuella testudinis]|uniref:Class I SAM-dependent methyltransferase n=1 Tax=Uruburuella testudinis TaxID=1282863 RepID=A0ABY4DTR0_9NEIS|nr:class I SAM-dependent methyltransferase [Uruburuella testudinis]UOO82429.1 class I SAM-dependent methyltransferase [Uruburuella testudinis]
MMTKWDERYLTDDYVFGTAPNEFIARVLPQLPQGGRALDLATGEGRNGVFLAQHGFQAEGVDMSAVGLAKAQKLAAEKGVRFDTRQQNIADMAWPSEQYAVITSVFCHFIEPERTQIAQRIIGALQAGGMFAGVFYHPDQIALGTGGPKDAAMLGTLAQMQTAFHGLEWLVAEEIERDLSEGSRHRGKSAVIYLLGRKP